MRLGVAGLAALVIACGGEPGRGVVENSDPAPTNSGCGRIWTARSGPDAIAPGEEGYRSYSVRAPDAGFIRQIRSVAAGDAGVVHHLFVTRAGSADETGQPLFPVLFAAGPDGGELELPPGVGLALSAGEELLLGLHVLNTRERSLEFDAGVELCMTNAVDEQASVLSFGPEDLWIPPGGAAESFSATCPIRGKHTLFAVFPHMHGHGTEIEVSLDGKPLADVRDWDPNHQPLVSLTPGVTAVDGQTLSVLCSYLNTTPDPIAWGHLASDEMCLAFVYYSPPGLPEGWGCR